jgi:hypothetical protein
MPRPKLDPGTPHIVGHGSRTVWGVHCFRSIGSQDHGFESHSGYGCLVFVCVFFYVCVQVEALRRADHPPKKSYRLSLIKKQKTQPLLQKRKQAPKCGSNEEEKKTSHIKVGKVTGCASFCVTLLL